MTDERAPRLPPDMGVIWPPDYPCPVVYRLIPGAEPRAQLLGDPHPLPLTAALREAIEADRPAHGR
jgi:hypothetical protein